MLIDLLCVTVGREEGKQEAKGIGDLENELEIELGIAPSELGNFEKEELKGEHVTHMGKLTKEGRQGLRISPSQNRRKPSDCHNKLVIRATTPGKAMVESSALSAIQNQIDELSKLTVEQDQNSPETESIPMAIEGTNDGCQVFDKMPSITSFDLPITEENGVVLDTISILAEFLANNFGAYAISIATASSDVLEFLQHGCHRKPLRVVPRFEKPEGNDGFNAFDSEDDIDPCIKSVGSNFPYMKRRKKLPDPVEKEKGVSLWSIIKDNIGKDLTQVFLPVYLNEPLFSLQKCFEDLEYSYLLDRAYEWWKRGNNLMRIFNVVAFVVSAYSSTKGRICKPFNPLLRETYEVDFPDKGLRFFSEKVSHHPMIVACHCQGTGWKLWGDSNLKSKFWGRSIQLDPVGVLTLEFDNGEVFQWSKVTTSIYNLILEKLYCDHQVHGIVQDRNGRTVASLLGKWDESMHYVIGDYYAKGKGQESFSETHTLWKRSNSPKYPTRYNLIRFAITLNELTSGLKEKLPPTDSRLRPDQSRLASQIWSEMQNDFLPNFILCNTTQHFIRSSKVPLALVQKPLVPHAKPNFYCGSRSLPWLIRALLDHISNKIATFDPMITGLQEALPKSIGLLPFDGGVTGCMRLVKEQLSWGTKPELKAEVLCGIKEIGSVLYWVGLLYIVLRELDTTHFMQTTAWLGLLSGADGQTLYSQNGGDNLVANLFKSSTAAMVSNPRCPNPASLYTMSKQAEAVDLLYMANLNTGSVLEYAFATFAFTSATLDKYCSKWSDAPKTRFIDITTSKDFVVLLSQIRYFDPWGQGSSKGGGIVTVGREEGKQEAKGIGDLENELGIELGIARSELGNFEKEELKGEHVTHMGKLTKEGRQGP
ncbi:Oxysterol-binding protein-related protein 2A [Hibiscus syriacus]|uniref:Oxysterol-binding protein-related protein 2A n=1 Tax=Hibiscus syriacus TaxID=106335 RepID=A0A6A3BV24_HIBSY|nr:Oxysterol-binding protein-related protein 2A [Hibiscus syriacus]